MVLVTLGQMSVYFGLSPILMGRIVQLTNYRTASSRVQNYLMCIVGVRVWCVVSHFGLKIKISRIQPQYLSTRDRWVTALDWSLWRFEPSAPWRYATSLVLALFLGFIKTLSPHFIHSFPLSSYSLLHPQTTSPPPSFPGVTKLSMASQSFKGSCSSIFLSPSLVCLFPSLSFNFLVCLVRMLIFYCCQLAVGVRLGCLVSFKACSVIFLHVCQQLPCHFEVGMFNYVTIHDHVILDIL